jgi:hypothetical protein
VKPEIIQQVRKLHGLTEEQLPDDADRRSLSSRLLWQSAANEPEPEPEPEPAPRTGARSDLSKLNLPRWRFSAIDTETLTQMRDRPRSASPRRTRRAEKTARESPRSRRRFSDRKIPPVPQGALHGPHAPGPRGHPRTARLEAREGGRPGSADSGPSEDVTASAACQRGRHRADPRARPKERSAA